MNEIREGLQILEKYDNHTVAAEHDVFYASDTPPERITHEDLVQLEKLHWHWDDSLDCWYHYT